MSHQNHPTLFPRAELEPLVLDSAMAKLESVARHPSKPRFNKPERLQAEMRCESLDQRLDPDHPARVIWQITQGLDLSPLYQDIRAVEGSPGRNPSNPQVLFALWLYAATGGAWGHSGFIQMAPSTRVRRQGKREAILECESYCLLARYFWRPLRPFSSLRIGVFLAGSRIATSNALLPA